MIKLVNGDCMEIIKKSPNFRCDLLLTDIPYGIEDKLGENHKQRGDLKICGKGHLERADKETFNLKEFLELTWNIFESTIIIFCSREQVSEICKFYSFKQKQKKGTVRQLIWNKTNRSPMNGKYIYLTSLENVVWFKKRGGTFNANCKPNFFNFASKRNKLHPTEKSHQLLEQLILDNSNENDKIFDPCAGSGSTLFIAKKLNRNAFGIEIDKEYYEIALKRLNE